MPSFVLYSEVKANFAIVLSAIYISLSAIYISPMSSHKCAMLNKDNKEISC